MVVSVKMYVTFVIYQGKVFPKLRKRSPHSSCESFSDKDEDEATDYVFRIIYPGSQEFGMWLCTVIICCSVNVVWTVIVKWLVFLYLVCIFHPVLWTSFLFL